MEGTGKYTITAILKWIKDHPIWSTAGVLLAVFGAFGDILGIYGMLTEHWESIVNFSGSPYFPWIKLFVLSAVLILSIAWAARRDTKVNETSQQTQKLLTDSIANQIQEINQKVIDETQTKLYGVVSQIQQHTGITRDTVNFWHLTRKREELLALQKSAIIVRDKYIREKIIDSMKFSQKDAHEFSLFFQTQIDSWKGKLGNLQYREEEYEHSLIPTQTQLMSQKLPNDISFDDRHERKYREALAVTDNYLGVFNAEIRICEQELKELGKRIGQSI